MRAPAPLRLGALLVGAYVAVAVATTAWAPGGMRPLFDGFGSHPGEYHWVNPPEKFAEGNRPPEKAEGTARLAADGSAPLSATPPDGQVLAQLQALSVAAHQPDETIRLVAEPVDAGTLGAVPAGLRAGGNAYRVTITYQPSGTVAETVAVPGKVALTSPEAATVLLFSADGSTWERRDAAALPGGLGVTGELHAPGYFLAAVDLALEDDSGGGVPVVVYVLGAAAVLGVAGFLLVRRRPAPAAPARGGRPDARRPGGGPGQARSKSSSSKRKRPKRPPPKRRR